MKKVIVSSIAVATMALSAGAQAAPFNYIDYAMGTVDYGSGASDGDYSNLSAVFETPIVPLISLESVDYGGADILKLGIGNYIELGSYTTLFGFVHYNDYDEADSDFSITAGVNSTLTDRLELRASYSTYTDHDGFDGFKVGLGYYFTENFSISGNYESLDFADITSFSARISF